MPDICIKLGNRHNVAVAEAGGNRCSEPDPVTLRIFWGYSEQEVVKLLPETNNQGNRIVKRTSCRFATSAENVDCRLDRCEVGNVVRDWSLGWGQFWYL